MKTFPFEIILSWYKDNGRHDLPWRHMQTPYHVWISEIFLQQTQVSRVREYFNNVVERFPDIHSLATTDYDTFFPYYKWLGYYSRARNMLKTAKIIVDEYDWEFPQSYSELLKLPGVWPYTSEAILAFWFDESILAFDTNIEKIFARYYLWSRFSKLSKEQKQELQAMFQKSWISWREINAALMDFSTAIDLNNKDSIDWDTYLLVDWVFFKERWKAEIKLEKKKKSLKKEWADLIIFIHKDHKVYYSENPDRLEPWILKNAPKEHRHFIQEYFEKKYNLELSVRPAHKQIKWEPNLFFYHAQVQTGTHDFWEFSKREKIESEDSFII